MICAYPPFYCLKVNVMKKYLIMIAALAACLFTIASCSSDNDSSATEEALKKGMEYLAENAKREGVVTTASGLQYEVLREGTKGGKRPTANDYVRCRYNGYFIDGKVFDQTSGDNSATFPLSGVIKGWTEGLQYMTEGAKFRFYIPYYLGYGANDYGPIPACSTLIFDVELLQVF